MKKWLATIAIFVIAGLTQTAAAQSGVDENLIGSWTLARVERERAGETERINSPRGLLIFDRVGNVFEFFGTGSREEPESPQLNPQRTFENFGGFWGTYSADSGDGTLSFNSHAGVSPSVRGIRFDRDYTLDGDVLVVTSGDEPQAQNQTRWTWQRAPVVEHLTPAYREVMGFWQHIQEYRVDLDTGEISNVRERAPSLIVYTPEGFVGVHFPGLGREPFEGDEPTEDEARDGLRGYIGYMGSLSVFPGQVAHNVLSGISPATGSILRRYAAITGDDLVVTLSAGLPQAGDGDRPRTATEVELKRLSDVDDMLR